MVPLKTIAIFWYCVSVKVTAPVPMPVTLMVVSDPIAASITPKLALRGVSQEEEPFAGWARDLLAVGIGFAYLSKL
jgi:hypothetical protein